MNTCPLPIDWLDLLAGRPSVASRAHLDSCPSCRAVVESLSDADTDSPNLTALSQVGAQARRDVWLTAPTSEKTPSAGEIWWLAAEGMANRLLVLVLDIVEEYVEAAFDVAPLWIDEDNAVPGDLLLDEADSTTGVRLRVAFRHQTIITRHVLSSWVGSLTDSGKASLENALTGLVPAAFTGVALESDVDPRLFADAWIRELMMTVASTLDEEKLRDSNQSTPLDSADVVVTKPGGTVFLFQVKRYRQDAPRTSQRLAAAAPSGGNSVTAAILHDNVHAIYIEAKLWLDSKADQLRLSPIRVSGLTGPVRLILHSRHLENPVEVETTLDTGEDVTLTSEAGISELDVESMELQLL
jgi:hypothetical protein